MREYIVVFGFLVFGFLFMAAMLQFSQFKKNGGGCCSDGLCETETEDSCLSCPNKDKEVCANQ